MSDGAGRGEFWLLDGRAGWRMREGRDLLFGATLRLAARPDGPLALASADGSLGGRTLPRGLALDDTLLLHLLVPADGTILRFDPQRRRMVPLAGIGGKGRADRQFFEPRGIAIAGPYLYVADTGNRRVQVFGLDRALALLHVFAPGAGAPRGWQPVDVAAAAAAAGVYILDAARSRLYRHRPGSDRLYPVPVPAAKPGDPARQWTRLAATRDGKLALLDTGGPAPRLDIYDPRARLRDRWLPLEASDDASALFEPPPVRAYDNLRDNRRLFLLPASLTRDCARRKPAAALPEDRPRPAKGDLLFDFRGASARYDPAEWLAPPLYCEEGAAVLGPLDSQLYRCQWHRVELDFADLPPGTRMAVRTVTAADDFAPPALTNGPGWSAAVTLHGPPQAPGPAPLATDALVQSSVGQMLWLEVRLAGDGFRSPALTAARIHYPRESYLRYLPAIFSADDTQRSFLERFLSIFQTEWDDLERRVGETWRLFDPLAAPGEEELWRLAALLGVPLEATWTADQQRALLAAVPQFFSKRGTPAGVRSFIRAYLDAMSGGVASRTEYPLLVEGFRERHRVMLGQAAATLGDQPALWGAAQTARLQLDADARVGEARIVSTNDPARDVFYEHSHRFRVYAPAAWIGDAAAERMLRRAIEAEKPAHASYTLCLVEPRFRVGVQSTVGIDMILGDVPAARLTCEGEQATAANAGPPQGRLGFDTVLDAAEPPRRRLAVPARIGEDTILT